MMERFFGSSVREDQGEWLSVSDMMAGLMVIFLFIAIVDLWQSQEEDICEALRNQFKTDLQGWNAQFGESSEDEDDSRCSLLIQFKSPETLFEAGKADLKPNFKQTLENFFPRYVNVLIPFKKRIKEIRIEGHTSSDWKDAKSEWDAYLHNMELSQDRTREVLRYSLELPVVAGQRTWLQPLLTANGLSSSRPMLDKKGNEVFSNPEIRLKSQVFMWRSGVGFEWTGRAFFEPVRRPQPR